MFRFSFSDAIGVSGIVFAVVLIVLDKAGKLKGPWLFILLSVAAVMTLCIAIGNAWVMDGPKEWRLWRGVLMLCVVGLTYSGLAIWISTRSSVVSVERISEDPEVLLSVACDHVSLPMPYRGDLWILDTVMFEGLGKLSAPPKDSDVLWPEDGVYGSGYKCTIKNYGTQTAFGVSLSLDVTVLNWVQLGPTSWGDGDPKQKRTIEISIPMPLGQQGGDQFSFYICSYDPASSLSVHMPLVGWINSDNSREKREVPVRLTAFRNPLSVPAKLMLSSHKKTKQHRK